MNKSLIIVIIFLLVVVGLFYFYQSENKNPSEINYVGNSPEKCSRIQVTCVEGFERFDNENGCGCKPL